MKKARRVKEGKKIVVLACSTGGPRALQSVVPFLPSNLASPVLIIQHMPVGFTNSLAIRLDETSEIKVKEAEDGDILQNGIIYIAKGGCQMRVIGNSENAKLVLTEEEARGGLKPCADITYESLIGSDYSEITCVVLTGMGGDGSAGIKQLNETNDIYVISQNEETCTVYGMPKVLEQTGLVNEVLPLNKIADAIKKHVGVQ